MPKAENNHFRNKMRLFICAIISNSSNNLVRKISTAAAEFSIFEKSALSLDNHFLENVLNNQQI